MISLYPDQEEFLAEIRKLWKSHLRICAMAGTGFGKTRVAARIIESCTERGMRVCFVVPRISLVGQTVKSFNDLGLDDITVQWGDSEVCSRALITVASIDTMIRRSRREYDLVIVDECHYKRVQLLEWMDEHPSERYLGLSATPFAGWMGNYYTSLAKSKDMRWLIDNERLAEYEVYAPDFPDLSSVKSRKGVMGNDYVESQLSEVMGDAKVVGNVVKNWLEHGENRLTLGLCVDVAHANHLMLEFNRSGVAAEVITAKTKVEERERVFGRMRQGITRIVLSVDCLTAGFDMPEITCIINARPTKSEMRYIQGMGRGLRYYKGQTTIIFDHSGTVLDLGYPEDITIDHLKTGDDGDEKEAKKKEREKKEKKPTLCTSCNYMKPAGEYVCSKCGFKPVAGQNVEVDESVGLKKLGKNKVATKEDKQLFWSHLKGLQREKGYSDGRIAHIYRDKFKVWPRSLSDRPVSAGMDVRNFIKSRNIAFAKSKNNR